jgi:tight adherence protein C
MGSVMIFSALLKHEIVIPIAVFGMAAAVTFWLLEKLAKERPRALDRLDELKNPRARRKRVEMSALKRSDKMTKMLERATPALAKPLKPRNEAELGRLKTRLANAGFRGEAVESIFLGLKFIGLLAGLFFGGTFFIALAGFHQRPMMYTVMAGGFLFYLPDIVVWFISKKRKQEIFLALPDAQDLMVVCVEAGLGLDQAMRKVVDEMKRAYRVITDEFGLANLQLQMGRSRTEVLHELGVRTGVADLRSLASVLIQADKFGSSIATALRVQSDAMRVRRRQLAEEKAAKTAVKLIFPLVLFIFPGIFVILVGPAAVTMSRELLPMMGK